MKNSILIALILTSVCGGKLFVQDKLTQPLQNVVTAYLNLKNALVKDNADSAQAAAKVLYQVVDKFPMEKLSASQHTIWMSYAEKLSYDTEHIKSTNDIDHQREHFGKLSVNMYKMLKAINDNATTL